MSQARPQVLALYREYLKLVRDWPADKVRPSRDMKQVLAQRVEETFRRPLQNEHEPFDIADAQRQLEALKKILNNEFKSEVNPLDMFLSFFLTMILNYIFPPLPCTTSSPYQTRSSHPPAIPTIIHDSSLFSMQQKKETRRV